MLRGPRPPRGTTFKPDLLSDNRIELNWCRLRTFEGLVDGRAFCRLTRSERVFSPGNPVEQVEIRVDSDARKHPLREGAKQPIGCGALVLCGNTVSKDSIEQNPRVRVRAIPKAYFEVFVANPNTILQAVG